MEDLTREWPAVIADAAKRRACRAPDLLVLGSPYRDFFGRSGWREDRSGGHVLDNDDGSIENPPAADRT